MGIVKQLTATAILFAASGWAFAQPTSKLTLDEAYAVVASKGMSSAAAEFNQGGKWKRGSSYVILIEYGGTMVAHSAFPNMVGKNMLEAIDANKKPFVKETIGNLKTTGKDSLVSFTWSNPATKRIEDGTVNARQVPGRDAYLGVITFE